METYHTSVLLQETIDALKIEPGKRYIDATLGGGGHTFEILRRGGQVLAIDTDRDAIEHVRKRIDSEAEEFDKRLRIVQGNFKDIEQIAKANRFEDVDGLLFDLGVSSHQFDAGERGFCFQKYGPLDMRMGTDVTVTAADLINGLHVGELTKLFVTYGEEFRAKMIAAAIIKAREKKRIETTTELAQIVEEALGKKFGEIHPATKVFQALRIAVNDELHSLAVAIKGSTSLLRSGGRLAVISFHSLEDRIVKHGFDSESSIIAVTKKPIIPTDEEIQHNRRARSAKLRIFEKV